MIPCNQINSVAAMLLDKLEKCTPLTQKDYKTLIDLILSVKSCTTTDPSFEGQDNIHISKDYSLEDIGADSFDDDIPLILSQYINTQNIVVNEVQMFYFKVFENSLRYQIYIVIGKGKGILNINKSELLKIEDTLLSNIEVFEEDINVSLPEGFTFGKYKNGDIVPSEGKTPMQVIIDALKTILYPSISNPKLIGTTTNVEVGTSTKTFNISFDRGVIKGNLNDDDVWDVNLTQGYILGPKESFIIDGNEIEEAPFTITKTTVNGTNSVTLKVNHDEGNDALDSYGNIYIPKTEAGIFTGTNITWQGFYYRYFIPKNNSTPPNNTEIRAVANTIGDFRKINSNGDIIIPVTTIDEYTHFHIYVPQTQTLVKVIDVNNAMNDITSSFIQQSNVTLPDAGGNNVTYKHYLKTVENATLSSTTYRATVT